MLQGFPVQACICSLFTSTPTSSLASENNPCDLLKDIYASKGLINKYHWKTPETGMPHWTFPIVHSGVNVKSSDNKEFPFSDHSGIEMC
jgi:hypothetical protein